MMSRKLCQSIGLASLLFVGSALADEIRYVQENGITYRETVRIQRRPVSDLSVEEREQTVLTPRVTTEVRESSRTVYTPVTEYRYEPRVHNWWNPFMQPHVAYHLVPSTRWEARAEIVRTPVTYQELIPETRIVQTPVRKLGFVDEKRIERVAVTPIPVPAGVGTSVAGRPVGSVGALQNDPPRYGTGTTVLR